VTRSEDARDEVRRLVNRDRPAGLSWADLSRDVQARLVSAAVSYADDADPYDAARAAVRRAERDGWLR
jgi:hypothetical protein